MLSGLTLQIIIIPAVALSTGSAIGKTPKLEAGRQVKQADRGSVGRGRGER